MTQFDQWQNNILITDYNLIIYRVNFMYLLHVCIPAKSTCMLDSKRFKNVSINI